MELLKRHYYNSRLDLGFGDFGLLHPHYHFLIRVRRNIISNDKLWSHMAPPPAEDGRSQLIVQLAGEALRSVAGRQLHFRPGDAALLPTSLPLEQVHLGSLRFLRLAWDPSWLGGERSPLPSTFSLSARGLETLQALSLRFEEAVPDRHLAAQIFRSILETLQHEGLPLDPEQCFDLWDPVPVAQSALARAIDRSSSSLGKRFSMLDLEADLGWSRHRIQYEMKKMCETYRIPEGYNLRRLAIRWRMLAGSFLMSSPKACTESVAEELGYASPRAFCNATANAGLPSPGALRETLLNLS